MGVLMGVAAVALDGGLLLDQRRRLQAVADAAALAAATDLYKNYRTNNGADGGGTAKASALATAAADGFSNDGTHSVVTVNIPPASGDHAGQAGYAEVVIQLNQTRLFSTLLGNGIITFKARAVARGLWTPLNSTILLLDPRATGALTSSSSGSVSIAAGPVTVDSNAAQAVINNGSGTLSASEFDIAGSPGTSGAGISGTVKAGATPIPDPFSYFYTPNFNLPNPGSLPLQSSVPTTIQDTDQTLNPGLYIGGISITGKANVVMLPGIYCLQGGGFSYTGTGNLTGASVMLFNVPLGANDTINIVGTGTVTMSPLATGLLQGFLIFQDPYSVLPVSITGNGKLNIIGTIYAAHGTLNVQGNGAANVIGSQYVVYRLAISGSGNFSVHHDIGLLARTRVIGLVE
jgi:Flp pilus assembly protein TadG